MCTFEVCLKIPDINRALQQKSDQFTFDSLLCEYTISRYDSSFNELMIKITGNADSCVLENLFLQIYKILFFNYGYFPEIVSAFKPQLSYYTSAKTNHAGFFRNFPPIVKDINHIVNENSLQKMVLMYNSPNTKIEPILHGFFSLFSHHYTSVVIEHKVLLLLHIFEGYGYFLSRTADKTNYATRHILKECFTSKNAKTKHEIFIDDYTKNIISKHIEPILQKIIQNTHINQGVSEIRNYYSHFYNNSDYQSGKTMLVLFFIISLSIRVRIVNDIITPICFFDVENENIKECFLIIADYVHETIFETQGYQIQSNSYKLAKKFEIFFKECVS